MPPHVEIRCTDSSARPQDDPRDPRFATPQGPGRDPEASLTTPSRRVRDSVFPRRGVQGRFGAVSQAFFGRFEATSTRVRKSLADDEKHRNSTGGIDLEQRHLRVQARVPGVRFS